ncbi:MAG: hypothetical protein HY650_11060, partial [Acidobacteria bacterium]|nr:hypothetical protein [Acidobacteriota bacterium]
SREYRLPGVRWKLQPRLACSGVEDTFKLGAVLDERVGERVQQLADRFLQRPALGLFLRACGALLLRLRERLESPLLFEAGDARRARLEIEPERSFDGDLTEAEVGGRKDAADEDLSALEFELLGSSF